MDIIATKNSIGELEEALNETPEIVLTGAELEQRLADRKAYDKNISRNKEHRQQVFALILGQVTPNPTRTTGEQIDLGGHLHQERP
jgi:hypothetical protein